MNYWILIADASGARVFATTAAGAPLRLERVWENPQGRARTQELVTDEPGRLNKGGAPGTRSAMDPRKSAHEMAAASFAAQLADTLDREAERGAFDSLAIAAAPHLLGLLRARVTKRVEQRVRVSLARDLVHCNLDELRPHLAPLFGAGASTAS